jgi:prepilin-type N-terminal cleavage/methylation domain-containing protein
MTIRSDQRGLTIVELLVVIIVSSIIMTVITTFALNYWTNSAVLQTDEETLVTRLTAGDYLRNTVNAASGLIIQNDLADNHVGNADPADGTGKHWLPIHAVPGTIAVGGTGTTTPLVYFNRPSINTSQAIIMNGTTPYQDDVVLYLNGTTKQLLARIVANPYAPGNRASTTCPVAIATTSCPRDTLIADQVSSVTMRYFSRSGNTIDHNSITDPLTGNYIGPDFPSVEVVEFNLKLLKKAQLKKGQTTINQTVVRVALRN